MVSGLFAAGLAILRLPVVQTKLVRWATAGGDGWKLAVARVSVGPSGGEVSGVEFAMPGVDARLEPGVEVRVAPGKFLFGGRELHVESARAEGVRVTITPKEFGTGSEDKSSAAGPGFRGLLDGMQSPLPWVLGQAKLGAEVLVRDGGEDIATARVKLQGGGISAAEAGQFSYELEADSRLLAMSPDAMIRSAGAAKVSQGPGNALAAVELRGDLRLPVIGDVSVPAGEFFLLVEKTAAGERYAGEVKLGPETQGAALRLAADFDAAGRKLTGKVNFKGEPAVLAWAGIGLDGMPTEGLRGTLDFSVGTDGGALTARLELGTEAEPGLLVAETTDGKTFLVELHGLPKKWVIEQASLLGLDAAQAMVTDTWQVKVSERESGVSSFKMDTISPLKVGPLALDDGLSPSLSGLMAVMDLAVEGTLERLTWNLRSVQVGPCLNMDMRAHARGEWRPTGVRVEEARVVVRQGQADVVVLDLAKPFGIGADGTPVWDTGSELARLTVGGWNLGCMERWTKGLGVGATWIEGVSIFRAEEDGAFSLRTETPWKFADLRLADAAGTNLFSGEAGFRPEVQLAADGKLSAKILGIEVKDQAGRSAGGLVEGWLDESGGYSLEAALDAKAPAGVAAPVALGDLSARLSFKARTMAERVGLVEGVDLTVSNGAGELVSLRSQADGGWYYAIRPDGTVLFVSQAPFRLKTAELPLSWLSGYMPEGAEVSGVVHAAEFLVASEPDIVKVRPVRFLEGSKLGFKQTGQEVVSDVAARFYPGLDLRVLYRVAPKFELAWEAQAHATEGRVDTPGGRALEFEAALGLTGDLAVMLPDSIDAVMRGDLAALKAGFPSMNGLPEAGKFTARVDGALTGKEPVSTWIRLEAVPAPGGGRVLAPVEVSARGKVNGRERTADMDVALRMGEGTTAGDLAFQARLALEAGTLRVNSALKGKSWDATETLAWLEATNGAKGSMSAANEVALQPAAVGDERVAAPIGSPFWGPLRGRFELDVGELRMAPYRVERLRGRVALEAESLVVDELGGEMFAGRLGGGFRVDYEAGADEGDHVLSGALRIEQFDTARVVQTVFKNDYGSLDTKVDLRAEVRGRGFRLWDLTERAEAKFWLNGKGAVRLTHSDARTASTILVMGGMLTLSPELRALGRLLRKFAEMPVDDLRIEGGRDSDGTVRLTRVRLDSPQARLKGTGEVKADKGVPLPARELRVGLDLSAREETGVILGRMRLLGKETDADGFRRLNQPLVLKGVAGRPDAGELYELLARGAAGSRGTWGLIMRKVQREVAKQQAASQAAEVKSKPPEAPK